MTLEAILNIISSVGFPIACAIALGIFIWKITITMITNQKEREDKLYDGLADTLNLWSENARICETVFCMIGISNKKGAVIWNGFKE